ncbi:hypothetical protein BDQ17DRAFT_1258584, partial [Cyathus striatus]
HHTYSVYSVHAGNSSISFIDNNNVVTPGFIEAIWTTNVSGNKKIFLILRLPLPLNNEDTMKNPYSSRPGLLAGLVYDSFTPEQQCIALEQVQSHVPFYQRPAATFGILFNTIVLVNSLHREHV